MKLRTLCLLATPPILAGVCSYLAITGGFRRAWLAVADPVPVIEYPSQIEFGPHEIGEQVAKPFTVKNRGGAELLIDDIESNCSCTGMEEIRDGRYVRVDSLRLKPGEEADVVMRVAVRGVPAGGKMLNLIHFRTNDPAQPAAEILAVVGPVSRGISATPSSIGFGTVRVGARVQYVLDVRDTARPPRAIERATSTCPGRVAVGIIPMKGQSRGTERDAEGMLIGQLEVTVNTAHPCEVNDAIQIHLAGQARTPDLVPVIGKVAAAVELSPSLLVLPRASSSGPVYSAVCACRSTDGRPLSVSIDSVPPGLTAQVESEPNPTLRLVRITCDPQNARKDGAGERRKVRLRAKAGQEEAVVEVDVLLEG